MDPVTIDICGQDPREVSIIGSIVHHFFQTVGVPSQNLSIKGVSKDELETRRTYSPSLMRIAITARDSKLPNSCNCVEFINEDGKRYAWSESNVCYEEVPENGASFALLRKRLTDAQTVRDALRAQVETVCAYIQTNFPLAFVPKDNGQPPEFQAVVIELLDKLPR